MTASFIPAGAGMKEARGGVRPWTKVPQHARQTVAGNFLEFSWFTIY
jgi:hypothetical protein